jgi:3'(2'), 5'-bisphosphate nucleotidase
MDADERNRLAVLFGNIASEAGRFIVSGFPHIRIETKPDGSPVSDADTGAENLIRGQLSAILRDVPVIGEETFNAGAVNDVPARFVLVDPIDGTRDFVAGGDQFTVNIAMIENGTPVAGCVYAPAARALYIGGHDAFRAEIEPGDLVRLEAARRIATAPYPATGLRAVVSLSHQDLASEALLLRIRTASRRAISSSLKFCAIAEGAADVYPRLSDTMEWDTAAGHAVLAAAGGRVLGRDGNPLLYGKPGFRNHGFVAWGREPLTPPLIS